MKFSNDKWKIILKNIKEKKEKEGTAGHFSNLYCRHALLNCMVCNQLKELGLYK